MLENFKDMARNTSKAKKNYIDQLSKKTKEFIIHKFKIQNNKL